MTANSTEENSVPITSKNSSAGLFRIQPLSGLLCSANGMTLYVQYISHLLQHLIIPSLTLYSSLLYHRTLYYHSCSRMSIQGPFCFRFFSKLGLPFLISSHAYSCATTLIIVPPLCLTVGPLFAIIKLWRRFLPGNGAFT